MDPKPENNKNGKIEGSSGFPGEPGGENMRLIELMAESFIDFLREVARNELSKPDVAFKDYDARIHTLFDKRIIHDKLRPMIEERLQKEIESAPEEFAKKLKEVARAWMEELFGPSVVDEGDAENTESREKKEIVLDEVAERIASAIYCESDAEKLSLSPWFNELRSAILGIPEMRGRVGVVRYVEALRRLPNKVREKLADEKKFPERRRVEKLDSVLKRLEEEVKEVIKEETGPFNN